VEIDFPDIIVKKVSAIRKHAALRSVLGPEIAFEKDGFVLKSSVLHMMSADLRKDPEETFLPVRDLLSSDLPTVVLAECVFPYMTTNTVSSILHWIRSTFVTVGVVSYDMFGLDDSFGRVMKNNLKMRNIELLGVEPSLATLQQRFTDAGFSTSSAFTLNAIRADILPKHERERVAHLEPLDEVEELNLVLDHYALSWGSATREMPSSKAWSMSFPEKIAVPSTQVTQ